MQTEKTIPGFKNTTVFHALLVFAIALLLVLIFVFFYLQNNLIVITNYSIELDSSKTTGLNDSTAVTTNPVKIVHLSDLHGNYLGGNNNDLISKIKAIAPDIVVITGDWIDQDTKDLAFFAKLINTIESVSPVFYISGNHEHWFGNMTEWVEILQQYNIKIMQNEIRTIKVKGRDVNILGLDEATVSLNSKEQADLFKSLESMDGLKIVLGHYPENFFYPRDFFYKNMKFDLFFTGHAHGGQFRLPFIGGVFSPGQGFFPMLYEGVHFSDDEKVVNNYFQTINKSKSISSIQSESSSLSVTNSPSNSQPGVNNNTNNISNISSYSNSLSASNGTTGKLPAMIISRGLGNSVIPQRLFNRPEIVVASVK
jgi:predicted MPP superfamily phosphohydrolase